MSDHNPAEIQISTCELMHNHPNPPSIIDTYMEAYFHRPKAVFGMANADKASPRGEKEITPLTGDHGIPLKRVAQITGFSIGKIRYIVDKDHLLYDDSFPKPINYEKNKSAKKRVKWSFSNQAIEQWIRQ